MKHNNVAVHRNVTLKQTIVDLHTISKAQGDSGSIILTISSKQLFIHAILFLQIQKWTNTRQSQIHVGQLHMMEQFL